MSNYRNDVNNNVSWTTASAPWNANANSLLKKGFLIAGIGFILICAVGIISEIIIKALVINAGISYDYDVNNLFKNNAIVMIQAISIIGIAAILISSIMSFIWVFRLDRASKTFIYSVFILYILGQGIGFGFLFFTLKASEIIGIFAIAGLMFVSMGFVGYTIKNGFGLGKYLVAGTIVFIILSLISMGMYFAGVYSKLWMIVVNIIFGFLMLLYTVYDVWMLRKFSQWNSDGDEMTKFRITYFFGFKLLCDLIGLIWALLRLYLLLKRN